MSTSVYVYSVCPDRLRAAAGSQDPTLLAAVRRREGGFFQMVDEIAEGCGQGSERPPRCADAVRQIIDGWPFGASYCYVCGYAYEALCMALGDDIKEPSWTQIAGATDWFEAIDAALATLAVPVRVADLLYRGPLIDLPRWPGYPNLGWWTTDE